VKPEDAIAYRVNYVLLNNNQVMTFQAKLPLEQVGAETKGADPVSLWKIVPRQAAGLKSSK
jgi:hypothetical protein